jgi:hypothetical protein
MIVGLLQASTKAGLARATAPGKFLVPLIASS